MPTVVQIHDLQCPQCVALQKEAREAEEARQKELEEIMPPQFGFKSFFGMNKNKVNPNDKKQKKK